MPLKNHPQPGIIHNYPPLCYVRTVVFIISHPFIKTILSLFIYSVCDEKLKKPPHKMLNFIEFTHKNLACT